MSDEHEKLVAYYRRQFNGLKASRTIERMSPYATTAEQRRFKRKLPNILTETELMAFKKVIALPRVDTYNSRTFTEYMYVQLRDDNHNIWYLARKVGAIVLQIVATHEFVNVEDNNPFRYYRNMPYIRFMDWAVVSTEDLPTGFKWSPVRVKTINYARDYLKASVLARYAMFQRPKNGLSNVVIDSFIPKLMYQNDFRMDRLLTESKLPATSLTISPWFAEMFQVKQMGVEQMARILGYTKRDIKRLLIDVRKRKHTITFVGYGGTGVNTIHWLTELCTITHIQNLFEGLSIYEPETLEISNLFRFPKNPEALFPIVPASYSSNSSNFSKLKLFTEYEGKTLSRTKPNLERTSVGLHALKYHTNVRNSILYGAPDIHTRELISKVDDMKFIGATHTGNSAYVHINPIQDSEIQLETYGLIQLSVFFMNQLKLAITLLEVLADDTIDLTAKDVEVLNYTFSQDESLTTDKKYNFQLDHDGRMVTAEEANAVV